MVRAERLMELADLLRSRDTATVAELAGELAVSPRTVLRDLATLRGRGMPIPGQAGRGGGVRFDRHRGSSPVHFSISEVVGIWLAAKLSREASNLPWSVAATGALSKLLASLPVTKARDLRTLCGRVIIGPPASSTIRGGVGVPPAELLRIFEDAFSRRQGLTFRYVDRGGRETRRTVEPHGLLIQSPVWYILSRDLEKREPRTFRMDRMSYPRVMTSIAFLPDADVVRVQVPSGGEWRPLSSIL
jgi:predicted DNA-binding transcriptional regulator YafY